VVMRCVDVLLAVPSFLIALIIVTATDPGPLSLGIGVGIGSIAVFARLTRTEVVRVRSLDYVQAARLSGASSAAIVRGHVLPAISGQLLGLLVVDFAAAILTISALGFLGFGAPAPTPEWGLTVAEGRQYMASGWWMTTLPGLVILCSAALLGVLGRRLRRD
jgi:peptide/nickel transport system permease protein